MAWLVGEDITAARLNAETAGAIVARGLRATTSTGTTATTSGTAQGVMRISGSLTSGRLYRVAAFGLGLYSSVSGDRATAQLTYTTDGSTPSVSSTVLTYGQVQCDGADIVHTLDLQGLYVPSGNITFGVLLSIYRQSGTGTVKAYGASDWGIRILIEDLGEDTGDDGTDI